jgi:hypothetical protein
MYADEINPAAVYGEPAAALLTGCSEAALGRARRLGYLQFGRVGTAGRSRVVYRGSWLLEWLAALEENQGRSASAAPRPSA